MAAIPKILQMKKVIRGKKTNGPEIARPGCNYNPYHLSVIHSSSLFAYILWKFQSIDLLQ